MTTLAAVELLKTWLFHHAPEFEPTPENYDDMESAYDNGHEVARWQAGETIRAAIAMIEGEAKSAQLGAAPEMTPEQFAMAAAEELIRGDGTPTSLQRAIDLSRQALGLPL